MIQAGPGSNACADVAFEVIADADIGGGCHGEIETYEGKECHRDQRDQNGKALLIPGSLSRRIWHRTHANNVSAAGQIFHGGETKAKAKTQTTQTSKTTWTLKRLH